jgi:anti-anti-sigma factor
MSLAQADLMKTECIYSGRVEFAAALAEIKEQKLSLRLESSRLGSAVVVHCHGRIVYHYEAAALSHKVAGLLEQNRNVIVDLHRVTAIDSAGLGELLALHLWARGHGRSLKLCGLTSRIRALLELTNLTSVLEVYATEEYAAEACEPEVA